MITDQRKKVAAKEKVNPAVTLTLKLKVAKISVFIARIRMKIVMLQAKEKVNLSQNPEEQRIFRINQEQTSLSHLLINRISQKVSRKAIRAKAEILLSLKRRKALKNPESQPKAILKAEENHQVNLAENLRAKSQVSRKHIRPDKGILRGLIEALHAQQLCIYP